MCGPSYVARNRPWGESSGYPSYMVAGFWPYIIQNNFFFFSLVSGDCKPSFRLLSRRVPMSPTPAAGERLPYTEWLIATLKESQYIQYRKLLHLHQETPKCAPSNFVPQVCPENFNFVSQVWLDRLPTGPPQIWRTTHTLFWDTLGTH